jgi:hypothetical protein
MKHILNDLTEQEKNAIREQHTGGMKVITENFSKLTNSKLGDVKLISEQPLPNKPSALVRSLSKPIVSMLPQIKACVAQGGYPKLTEFLKKQENKQLDNIVIDMLMTFSVKKDPQASSEIGKLIECLKKTTGVSEQVQDKVSSVSSSLTAPKVVKDKMTSSQTNNVVPCAQLGVKSPGVCETKTKKPVKYCSELGVKSPGFCYVDTKQPVPGLKATPATKSQKTGNSVHMN